MNTFPGFGTVINAVLVILASLIGLTFKKAIPEKLKSSIVQALALAVTAVGITGMISASCSVKDGNLLSSNYVMLMVISLAVGTFIGELADIDKALEKLGGFLQKKAASGDSSSFAEGFITASLVFCVGSMSILGSLTDGINHDPTILLTKSILDFVMAIIFSSTLGIGVMFSSVVILVYQGLITLCANALSPFLTAEIISQMSFIGSILIMGIGLNFIYSPKLKLANMLPAMFIPPIWYLILNLFKGVAL